VSLSPADALASWRLRRAVWPISVLLFGNELQNIQGGLWWVTPAAVLWLAAPLLTPAHLSAGLFGASAWWFVVVTWPGTANHGYVMAIALTLIAWGLAAPDRARRSLALLRTFGVSVIWGAGLQKVALGTYDRAEFFAFEISTGEGRFGHLAGLLPRMEAARLNDLHGAPGGPYATGGALRVASLAVMALELTLPLVVLAVPRARAAAVVLLILLVLAMQLVCLELTFGVVMAALLASWLPRRWERSHGHWLTAVATALAVALVAGVAATGLN
jgi:hypothetical protein